MTRTHTYTQTYTVVKFADPYKSCHVCGQWVDGIKKWSGGLSDQNYPCGHGLGYNDLCPSWGPVDGCQCLEQLGDRKHPVRLLE